MAVYLWIIRHNEVAKNLRGLGLIGPPKCRPF